MLLLALVPSSRCWIRLDNQKFKKISKDFHFFYDPHHLKMDLKSSFGEAQGVFWQIYVLTQL